jgi:pilus assembly protein Flp/PilA
MACLGDCRPGTFTLKILCMQPTETQIPALAARPRLRRTPGIKASLMRLITDDSGQDLIEYALLAALVGCGAVLSIKGLSNKIGNTFNSIGTSLTTA